jgi:hypothetical protein
MFVFVDINALDVLFFFTTIRLQALFSLSGTCSVQLQLAARRVSNAFVFVIISALKGFFLTA